LRNRKFAALSRYLATTEGKNFVITNLVADVASAYYELLALDTELGIVRESITLQEKAVELIRVQHESGAANKLAVEQFEAQLLNSKTTEKEIHQRIMETEVQLNNLLGSFPETVDRDTTAFFRSDDFQVNTGVPPDLLRYRPDIRQAEYEVLAAKADLGAARAAFLPSFNITGAYGFQAYKTKFLFQTPESIAYSILGGLTTPLINRSAIRAEFHISKATQIESLYNYQKSVLNAYAEVFVETSNLRMLNDIFELKSSEAALLNSSIETSGELFKARRANYLEVIVVQKNALQAKQELVDVRKRQYFSRINLYKALGGGWSN
jgi:multidrug efflux system outer membrane protein